MAEKNAPKSTPTENAQSESPEARALAEARARVVELEEANARLEQNAEADYGEIRRLRGILDALQDRQDGRAEEATGGEVVTLRALRGIRFALGSEPKRLRQGDTVRARVADLTDDALVEGVDFAVVAR